MAAVLLSKRTRYGRWRLLSLVLAFLLILIAPLLNYFYGISFVQGWFQSISIGHLWFVSPLEGLESLLVTRSLYVPALIGMVIPVLLAMLLGRVFCSWVCPISFFAELIERARRWVFRRKNLRDRLILSKRVLWYGLIGELLLTMILGTPIFVFLSPPGLVGREIMMVVFFHKLAMEGIVLLAVLLFELVTRRFYCRYFCPLGGLLALIGSRRRLHVHQDKGTCVQCGLCDMVCPMGIQPSVGEAVSAYCWNCGGCVDVCSPGSLAFGWAQRAPERNPTGFRAVDSGHL